MELAKQWEDDTAETVPDPDEETQAWQGYAKKRHPDDGIPPPPKARPRTAAKSAAQPRQKMEDMEVDFPPLPPHPASSTWTQPPDPEEQDLQEQIKQQQKMIQEQMQFLTTQSNTLKQQIAVYEARKRARLQLTPKAPPALPAASVGQAVLLERLRQEIPQQEQHPMTLHQQLTELHQQKQQTQQEQTTQQQMLQSRLQQMQSQQGQTVQSPQQQITQSQQGQTLQSQQQQITQSQQGQGAQPFTPLTEPTPMTPPPNVHRLLAQYRERMAPQLAQVEQQAFQEERARQRRRDIELEHLEWMQEQYYLEEVRQKAEQQQRLQQQLWARASSKTLLQPQKPEPKVQIQPPKPPQQQQQSPASNASLCPGSNLHV